MRPRKYPICALGFLVGVVVGEVARDRYAREPVLHASLAQRRSPALPCRSHYAAGSGVRWNVVPTLFWMNAPGRWRAIVWVACQPVRWAGTITSGASCPSARTVSAMTGSDSGPLRRNPGAAAAR